MKQQLRFLTTALALSVSIASAGCSDEAEELGGKQVNVNLAYGEGSNYGPKDATGLAYIDTATGLVEIDVVGLPELQGEVYEGWLAGGDETPISTGRFNTNGQGTGSSSITLGDISKRTYQRVVLTVEPDPDPTPAPDPRHSIEGFIP
jgi:hypothetical protein